MQSTQFKNLCRRIDRIDKEAAQYVRKHSDYPDSDSPELSNAFIFEHTPQGHNYWVNICEILDSRPGKGGWTSKED